MATGLTLYPWVLHAHNVALTLARYFRLAPWMQARQEQAPCPALLNFRVFFKVLKNVISLLLCIWYTQGLETSYWHYRPFKIYFLILYRRSTGKMFINYSIPTPYKRSLLVCWRQGIFGSQRCWFFPGAPATSRCEPPDTGARKWIWVFWKSSSYS